MREFGDTTHPLIIANDSSLEKYEPSGTKVTVCFPDTVEQNNHTHTHTPPSFTSPSQGITVKEKKLDDIANTHTQSHAHTHTQTHTYTYTHKHTNIHKNTQTHRHTHT